MLSRPRLAPAVALPLVRTGVVGLPARPSRRRGRQAMALASATLFAISAVSGLNSTGAVFTSNRDLAASVGTKRIFAGERVTSGFDVHELSSGVVVDRSSAFAFAGDSRTSTTKAWSPSFDLSRYLQFDMSAPLPGGLTVTAAAFRLTFASAGPSTACVYVELRRISTDAVVATHGSAGSPSACVNGTTFTTLVQAVPSIASTGPANDLRLRVYGDESGSRAIVVDEARFTGSTPYVAFSTYPVRWVDAADGVALSTPWDLQGP